MKQQLLWLLIGCLAPVSLLAQAALSGGMHPRTPEWKVMFDRLEMVESGNNTGGRWDVTAWYGKPLDSIQLTSEGEDWQGKQADASVQLAWNHAVLPFWNAQFGVRQDMGNGSDRRWAMLGVAGTFPWFVEGELAAYWGEAGRLAARAEASHDLRITQRVLLESSAEVWLYDRDDRVNGIESGLSQVSAGLRLRYQLWRRFAPYIGMTWQWQLRKQHYAEDRQWIAGFRVWF